MSEVNRGVLVAVTLCVACGTEPAPDTRPIAAKADLEIYHAYAPASPAPDVASLYFTVVNAGSTPDTVTAVRSDAGVAMLHETVTEHGLTSMQHVSAIAIEPQDTLRLVPGSYHVMLSRLAKPLEVGDTISVHVQFAQAGELRFEAVVLTYTDVVELLEGER
jgi:copper(I)-binding protein